MNTYHLVSALAACAFVMGLAHERAPRHADWHGQSVDVAGIMNVGALLSHNADGAIALSNKRQLARSDSATLVYRL